MDFHSYFDYCDHLIKTWRESPASLIKEDPFLKRQTEEKGLLTKEYFNTMPEPFLGNPMCCSIVVINLNPGYTEKNGTTPGDEEILSRVFAQRLNSYVQYALPFPHLMDNPYHKSGGAWWRGRNEYLQNVVRTYLRINNAKDAEDYLNKRHPFAIELCPWHSKNWSESKISIKNNQEIIDAIKEHTLTPAMNAIQNSLVDFAIAIGQDSFEALYDSGFELKMSWGPDKDIEGRAFKNIHVNNCCFNNYPQTMKVKNKGKYNQEQVGAYYAYVFFRFLAREVNGKLFKVLNITKRGSNQPPGPEYRKRGIEEIILRYIQEYK